MSFRHRNTPVPFLESRAASIRRNSAAFWLARALRKSLLVDTTTIAAAERKTRVIRRYVNRKYYDTQNSRYVNLAEIARAIRSGEDVRVLEVPSRRDLTGSILASILSEEERRSAATSAQELSELIRRRPERATIEVVPVDEPAHPRSPPTPEQVVNVLLCRGQRAAFAAQQRLASANIALERIDVASRGRIDGACQVVRGIEQVREHLSRAARRIVELHERLRDLESAAAGEG
jgi:polyhydroxyalkanoate synthesis repressor PhaR